MIEQQGFLRLVKGSLGKTTFVKSKDGYREFLYRQGVIAFFPAISELLVSNK